MCELDFLTSSIHSPMNCIKSHTAIQPDIRNSAIHVPHSPPLRNSIISPCATEKDLPPIDDPTRLVEWGGRLPSRRRLIGGLGVSSLIALGGNLGGCSSALLSSFDNGKTAQAIGIDILIPINGKKRYRDQRKGFELTFPSMWLQDYTIAEREQRRAEARRAIDPPSLSTVRSRQQQVQEPTVAFGPAGSNGESNISVIVAPIFPGFTMQGSFGSPEEGARRFLGSIAPQGSGRVATLVRAIERPTSELAVGGAEPLYELEYIIQGPGFNRHNVSVIGTQLIQSGGHMQPFLYTFNAQCPQNRWATLQPLLVASASSFTLLPGARLV
jgi:hypothetical protein